MWSGTVSVNNIDISVAKCWLCKNWLSEAKILPCLDSFCLKCLENYQLNSPASNWPACPRCGETFDVQPGQFSTLPNSDFMQRLVEICRISNLDPADMMCDICRSCGTNSNTSIYYCLQCSQTMCRSHEEGHKFFAATKRHDVVEFGLQSLNVVEEMRKKQNSFCSQHVNKDITLFCDSCEEPICTSCMKDKHMQHPYTTISDNVSAFSVGLHKLCEQLTSTISEQTSVSTSFNENNDSLSHKLSQAEIAICQSAEDLKLILVEQVEDSKQKLLSKLVPVQAKLLIDKETVHKVTHLLEMLNKLTDVCKAVLKKGHDVDLLFYYKKIQHQTHKILLYILGQEYQPPVGIDLKFTACDYNQLKHTFNFSDNLLGRVSTGKWRTFFV